MLPLVEVLVGGVIRVIGDTVRGVFDLTSASATLLTGTLFVQGVTRRSAKAALEELNRTSAPISPLMRDLFNGIIEEPGLDITSVYLLPLSTSQVGLLEAFLASTSLEVLVLEVIMTLEQILSLFKSADFSRLNRLRLWAKGFTTAQVDTIITGLQHTRNLEILELGYTPITTDQVERMKMRGVILSSNWD